MQPSRATKRRSPLSWVIAAGMGLVLLAPLSACEDDPTGGAGFTPPEFAPVEAGPPPTTTATPDAGGPPTVIEDAGDDAESDASRPPRCDDGKIDADETCDPLSSCPTSCPPVECQLRTLENVGTCQAKCTDTALQTECINGDGCCPPGCNKNNDDDCDVVCDNGAVETGETCDPLETCPTSCPPIGCQLRRLEGAGTCAAECVADGKKTVCQNDDGCCPDGCTTANDNDCEPGCGNNVIDSGETCDPLETCPTSCPPVACRLRKLVNGGTCQAACVDDGPVTACINDDGCCPDGCNANNDNDCKPVCGNGVPESGETCDPLVSCPTSCPQKACQLYTLQNAGTCQARCEASGQQTACVHDDGCCPNDCNANNDNDCESQCGNRIVEPGETCDGDCPKECPREVYSCYETRGARETCDLACHSPVQRCGGRTDGCCPFDAAGGCSAESDPDCRGSGWKWIEWPTPLKIDRGCVEIFIADIEPGASYEITTCAPPGSSGTGEGDPNITEIIDNSGATYPTNDNCTDTTALPHLARSECRNRAGVLTMACASPSPGGFTAAGKANGFRVTVCSDKAGSVSTPLYIWFNATKEPTPAKPPR